MKILHKRTTNNIDALTEALDIGEIGLILQDNDVRMVCKTNNNTIAEFNSSSIIDGGSYGQDHIVSYFSVTTNSSPYYQYKINNITKSGKNGEIVMVQPSATSMNAMFKEQDNIVSIDVSHLYTGATQDMAEMFQTCDSLTSIDISNFDTSHVTSFRSMFSNSPNIESINIGDIDMSNAIEIGGMFCNLPKITSIDLSQQHCRHVQTVDWLFYGGTNLQSVSLMTFGDDCQITTTQNMFGNCPNLTHIDMKNFYVTSALTTYNNMFNGVSPNVTITCTNAFKEWCRSHASAIALPNALTEANSPQWIVI